LAVNRRWTPLPSGSGRNSPARRPIVDVRNLPNEALGAPGAGAKAEVGVWHGRKHHEKAGAPSFALFAKGGIRDGRFRDSWYPTLRKKREGPRISYYAAPAMGACAAFF
jgi:hypothetical protein